MRSERRQGFTLTELLVVVAIISTFAAVAIPLLSSHDSTKLDVAAEEVGNALRFAAEGGRTGAYILVDAMTAPGHLKVFSSNAGGTALGPVNDPLTKRAFDIKFNGGAFSGSVGMTPAFIGGGTAYTQLLIGPAGQLQAFNGPSANMGALQAGSGIVLTLGSSSLSVTINPTTGFVAIPQ